MKNSVYKNTITFLFLFACVAVYGQKKYDVNITTGEFTVADKQLKGFTTSFDFTRKEVRRGWWRYAKKIGNPLNMRSYYQVTIPAEMTDGNVDLMIYTQTVEKGNGAVFTIGIEETEFHTQVKEMLLDFKKNFYIQYYLDKVERAQKDAKRLGKKYEKAGERKKQGLLDRLEAKSEEVETLKGYIKEVGSK